MDTEEDVKIQKAIRLGKPQTDEGPYYHEPWWESYKGSIKGKLGGLIIGAAVGALVGAIAAFALPAIGAITLTAGGVGGMIAATAAAGMLYGLHEFGDIGKIVGSNAATAEKQEKRLKDFESQKFSELKQEMDEIKFMIAGKAPPAVTSAATATGNPAEREEGYRTTHCDTEHCPPKNNKLVFWKVAAIGLVVGMGVGALLAYGGVAAELLHILGQGVIVAHEGTGLYAASMGLAGLIGASFGINRDMFRQVFDKTDLWFRGILKNGHKRDRQIAKAQQAAKALAVENPPKATHGVAAATLYEGYIDYPTSNTYHRDRVLAAAEKALLSFDHTRATPQ